MTTVLIQMKIKNNFSGNSKKDSYASLSLDGVPVIQHIVNFEDNQGAMYLQDHLLIFILEGSAKIIYGNEIFNVNKNEMILLKKATFVYYEKYIGQEDREIFDCMMFTIKEELVKSFLTITELNISKRYDTRRSSVEPVNDCLIAFTGSLQPYFKDADKVAPSQLRRKMMEMLYDTAVCSENMFGQILHLQNPVRENLREVIEQNYASPASLEELAYLSGRSLSSFKRDFQKVFNMAPAAWIRKTRLNKAKEMLESTNLTVNEICYSLGFENVSHFSRIYKDYHGSPPTNFRQRTIL